MNSSQKVLEVRGTADGYWYMGAGRSIADGPYRDPGQLLSVAADLLSGELHWRIDVYDVSGHQIVSYSSEELQAKDLHPQHWQTSHRWNLLVNHPQTEEHPRP